MAVGRTYHHWDGNIVKERQGAEGVGGSPARLGDLGQLCLRSDAEPAGQSHEGKVKVEREAT